MSKSIFNDLFKEEDEIIKGVLEGQTITENPPLSDSKNNEPLHLPDPEQTPKDELSLWWRNLRTFYRTGKGGGLPSTKKGPSLRPALLTSYHNVEHVSSEYPYCTIDGTEDFTSGPLTDLVHAAIETYAADKGQAQTLKSNVARLVNMVSDQLKDSSPAPLTSLLSSALDRILKDLAIKGDEGKQFEEDIKKLKMALPNGYVIPFSPDAHLHIFSRALVQHLSEKRTELKQRLSKLIGKITDILAVEKTKGPEANQPKNLQSSLDIAGSYLDFDVLSKLTPKNGSEMMPKEKVQRISKLLAILQNAENVLFSKDAVILVSNTLYNSKSTNWKNIFPTSLISTSKKGSGCKQIQEIYDGHMTVLAETVAAIRMAELEVVSKYDQEIHGDYFAHFDWRAFTEAEMASCPPVVLIQNVKSILSSELSDYSHLLASGRAVKVLAVKQSTGVDHHQNGSAKEEEFIIQQELGALTISYRNVFILQGTPITPGKMSTGFLTGLSRFTPTLFYTLTSYNQVTGDPYLWTIAAIEGREFPGFTYDSDLSPIWGARFDVTNNPNYQDDWPAYDLTAIDVNGKEVKLSTHFTFADFAAQDALYQSQFTPVPPQYWSDDLVPIDEFLNLDNEAAYSKVPFIWMADKDNQLQKIAVSYNIALSCRERLDLWHSLQDHGGLKSYHADQAIEKLRGELEIEKQAEIDDLKKELDDKLETVRNETSGETMERLTSFLLDLDTNSLIPSPSQEQVPVTNPEVKVTESVEEEVIEKPVEPSTDLLQAEAWIETSMCTTCNECLDLNPNVFKYNTDKQAIIEDATAGTFAEMVEAAEKCPAKIIHPGTPINQDEPDLEDLLKRAEKFN